MSGRSVSVIITSRRGARMGLPGIGSHVHRTIQLLPFLRAVAAGENPCVPDDNEVCGIDDERCSSAGRAFDTDLCW